MLIAAIIAATVLFVADLFLFVTACSEPVCEHFGARVVAAIMCCSHCFADSAIWWLLCYYSHLLASLCFYGGHVLL